MPERKPESKVEEMIERLWVEHYHCNVSGVNVVGKHGFRLALLELQRETQRETLMEAARLECPFCAGADGTIDTIPHFYSGKQYISNYGEVENEYIHASNWGGHFGCNAQKIMAEIARRCELERKAKERI